MLLNSDEPAGRLVISILEPPLRGAGPSSSCRCMGLVSSKEDTGDGRRHECSQTSGCHRFDA
jgi:hypothetical protein